MTKQNSTRIFWNEPDPGEENKVLWITTALGLIALLAFLCYQL
jgi:hypothetical protein